MFTGSRTIALVGWLLCALSSTGQAFTCSLSRQRLAVVSPATARATSRFSPLRDKSSPELDIRSLVNEAASFATFSETTILSNIAPHLLTVDEAELKRDEKYMSEAIKMAQSEYVSQHGRSSSLTTGSLLLASR